MTDSSGQFEAHKYRRRLLWCDQQPLGDKELSGASLSPAKSTDHQLKAAILRRAFAFLAALTASSPLP
jgi:hypothetical protein